MAEENVIGLAMQLDVSDLKTGIKEANKIIATSKDEFKNATAGMDMWSKSSEGLTAKLDQLGKQLSAQEKIAAGYEAEIARVSEQEGDHSEELKKLQGQLQKTQNAIKETQKNISHYSESLSEAQREEKDANSALGKLTKTIGDQKKQLNNLTNDYKAAVIQYGKNSTEAKALARQIKDLSGEIEDNEGQVEEAEAVLLLGGEAYAPAAAAVPPTVMGVVCQCLYAHYINIVLQNAVILELPILIADLHIPAVFFKCAAPCFLADR